MSNETHESPAWSASKWELSAPESHVLLHGVKSTDTTPFKLAVMELVARGGLHIVESSERHWYGNSKTSLLTASSSFTRPSDPTLAPIWDLYYEGPAKTMADGTSGLAVQELARRAQHRYRAIAQFTTQVVASRLIERGLLREERGRVLGVFPTTNFERTAEGEAARADLEQRIELANAEVAGWVENDPRRALAFVALAGAALLLMPPLFPELEHLKRKLQDDASSSGSGSETAWLASSSDTNGNGDVPGSPGNDQPPPGDPLIPAPTPTLTPDSAPLDLSSLSFDLGSLDFDFGALDSMDSAFSAIDSGVDSGGGGDGGGDGGGGGGGD